MRQNRSERPGRALEGPKVTQRAKRLQVLLPPEPARPIRKLHVRALRELEPRFALPYMTSMTLADKLKAKIHELTDRYLEADARSQRAYRDDDDRCAASAKAESHMLRGVIADLSCAHSCEAVNGDGMIMLCRVIVAAMKAKNNEIVSQLQDIVESCDATEKTE